MNDIEMLEDEDDLDGSEEHDALSMVLANMGDSVRNMRKKRLMSPRASVKVVSVGDGEELNPVDPLAEGDVELSEEELAKLEALL